MSKQSELEGVAKDWSMTIRASQIIPVYPLTEDLQPGDIFLVQVPIDRQQVIYEKKGFLPLDNMICRVHPKGYKNFYGNSFFTSSETILPKSWLTTDPAWSLAPTAKFPTYSFSVKKGGGFNLALPVQGVPIGLSLLGGDAAYGSIVIADAKTYGIDVISLEQDVRDWAQKNQVFLANFSSGEGEKNYLRVVSRVYIAGKLNISIQSGRSASAGVSAGMSKPVDLIVPGVGPDVEKNTTDTYTKNLEKLNTMIEGALKTINIGEKAGDLIPGATVKVVTASSNSISLNETFLRPVVIGYLGFDMEIQSGGELGPPIPTHAILSKEVKYSNLTHVSSADIHRTYQTLKKWKDKDKEANRLVEELDRLTIYVPQEYPCNIYGFDDEQGNLNVKYEKGKKITDNKSDFSTVTTYRGKLVRSIEVLKEVIAKEKGKEPIAKTKVVELDEYLKCNEDELAKLENGLSKHIVLLRQAADHANKLKYGG
ncbi:MAG: hypothetical protein ABFD82_19780 [Syntrophaceae bacterium]